MMPIRLLRIPVALLVILLACAFGTTMSNAALPGGRHLVIAGQDPVDQEAKVETQDVEAAIPFCEGDCAGCDQKCPPAYSSPVAVLEDGCLAATCACVDEAALTELRELIDKLAGSGELSADGADQLRAAVAGILARPEVVTIKEFAVGGEPDTDTMIVKTIVSEAGDSAPVTIKLLKLEGTDDNGVTKVWIDGEDALNDALDAFTIKLDSDSKMRTLNITTDEDGNVVVKGEGFNDEELEQIRDEVQGLDAENFTIEIEDDVLVLKAAGGMGEDPSIVFLDELPELEQLEKLMELPEMVELKELDGLPGEAWLEAHDEFLKQMEDYQADVDKLFNDINVAELEQLEKVFIVGELDEDDLQEIYELENLKVLEELPQLLEIEELTELDEEWNAELEAEIGKVLAEIEDILREFAREYSTK